MTIHEIIRNRRQEVISQIETLQKELSEIDRFLDVPSMDVTVSSKDDAIIQAIRAGNRTPAAIADFIRSQLGLEVNPASTRTRLSRMKADGKIKHDGIGWSL